MQLVERRARRNALWRDEGPCSGARWICRQHAWRGLAILGLRPAFIGRVQDDALGAVLCEGDGRGRHRFRQSAGCGRRIADIAIDDFRVPRRRAVDEHLSGHFVRAGPRRRRRQRGRWHADRSFLKGIFTTNPKAKRRSSAPRACAVKSGGRAGIALSDPFCVDRHRDDFRRLVSELDYVIGNEHEWESLYQTDLSTALEQASSDCRHWWSAPGRVTTCCCSAEARRCPCRSRGSSRSMQLVRVISSRPGSFTAMQLASRLETAGRMGCVAAAEVISHYGARPEADLKALFRKNALI